MSYSHPQGDMVTDKLIGSATELAVKSSEPMTAIPLLGDIELDMDVAVEPYDCCCGCCECPMQCCCFPEMNIACPSIRSSRARVELLIHPEFFRFIGYLAFWSMVLFAKILTEVLVRPYFEGVSTGLVGPEAFDTDTHLIAVFGYNNICVYWDYTPAREVTSFIYPLVELPIIFYVILNFMRVHALYANRKAGVTVDILSKIAIGAGLSFVGVYWFRQIFVIQVFASPSGHTLGFIGLMVALVLTSFQNYTFNEMSDNHPTNITACNKGYLILLSIVTFAKVVYDIIMLAANGKYQIKDSTLASVMQAVDVAWLILAALLPVGFSLIGMANTNSMAVIWRYGTPPEYEDDVDKFIAEYENGDSACKKFFKSSPCTPFRLLYYLIKGIVAIAILLVVMVLTAIMLFFFMIGFLCSCAPCRGGRLASPLSFIRRCIGDSRLVLESTRDYNFCFKLVTFWHLRHAIVGFYQVVEYLLNVSALVLGDLTREYYGVFNEGNYPFLFGVVMTDREECLEFIYEENQLREGHFRNLKAAPGLIQYTWPHLQTSDTRLFHMARGITELMIGDVYNEIPTEELASRVTPGVPDTITTEVWNNILFYRLFGVRMTIPEIEYYSATKLTTIGLDHFPQEFHFLIAGGLIWRQSEALREWTVERILEKRSPRLQQILDFAEEHGYDPNHVLRAASYAFNTAGGPIEVRLLHLKFAEQPELAEKFRQDPMAFMIDWLRIYTSPVISGHLLRDEKTMQFDGKEYRIPPGAAVCAGLGVLNRDPYKFQNPVDVQLDRENQNENVVFNRLYEESKPAQRGCPARYNNFAAQMLVDTYVPYIG